MKIIDSKIEFEKFDNYEGISKTGEDKYKTETLKIVTLYIDEVDNDILPEFVLTLQDKYGKYHDYEVNGNELTLYILT